MYGLVNAAIQELVCSKFGADKWEAIKKKAGVDLQVFNRMQPYPEEMTYNLVGAVSEVLNIPADDVMKAFGEWWVLYTGQVGYGHMFQIAGGSLRDFLYNLDNLHSRIGQNFSQLRPPSFVCEDLDDHTVRMHYYSERAGLCPMVVGLLDGLGKRFNTPVEIEHPICVRNQAEHCEFIVRMAAAK
jgi:hypothetical protein